MFPWNIFSLKVNQFNCVTHVISVTYVPAGKSKVHEVNEFDQVSCFTNVTHTLIYTYITSWTISLGKSPNSIKSHITGVIHSSMHLWEIVKILKSTMSTRFNMSPMSHMCFHDLFPMDCQPIQSCGKHQPCHPCSFGKYSWSQSSQHSFTLHPCHMHNQTQIYTYTSSWSISLDKPTKPTMSHTLPMTPICHVEVA